jgi:hypothetical protein
VWDGRARRAGASDTGWARSNSEAERVRGVRTRRPRLEKAAALEKASGRRVARWLRPWRSHACDSGESKCRCVFYFLKKSRHTEGGAEEACWARSLDRPGNDLSRRNTPRQTSLSQHYRFIIKSCLPICFFMTGRSSN